MKKSEKLKSKRKNKFKYFLLAHVLTLFFALANFSFAADKSFDFGQKNAYSEPFSKLIEFLKDKKEELDNYDGNFIEAKIFLNNNNSNLSALPRRQAGDEAGDANYAAELNPNSSSFLASVLGSVKDTMKNVFDSAKSFVFTGDNQNSFEYLSPTSEENAKEIENLKQQYESAIKEANDLKQKFTLFQNEMGKIKAGGVIVKEPVIEQRMVEKTVEKIISGLSQTDLDSGISSLKSELANLNTNLTNKINNLSSDTSRQTSAVYNAVSLTNKIDSLSGTRLSNITVSGVSGLADSDIPDTITASNYLLLTGGTITGSTTISGQTNLFSASTTNLTVTGNAWFISGNVGIGTTSPYAKLSVVGPVAAEYFHATSTTATSTFSGQLVAGFAPTWAHSFGSWSVGASGANPLGASLAINPSSAASDSNLLSLSVNGSAKFLVDAEGDVFANAVTVVGGTTLSTTIAATFTVENNTTLGDSTTTDITYFNSRIADSLIPTADNALDLGDSANWLRWRTGYFGTSVGIGGTATSTGSQLTTSGAYLIDSNGALSINTTNNKAVSFGTGNVSLPYASSTALTVTGSTYLTGLGQGWIHTAGGVNALSASTSPTVNYLTATSTTATSTFPYLAVTANSNLGTVVGGVWQGTVIGDAYLTKSGDWTGTIDTYEAANLLARANHTGTQGVATLSNYDLSFSSNYGTNNLTASTTMPWWAQGGLNASSTSHFVYASTTALTVSGNSYLGTVSSGAWNGTAVSNQYGGTGLDSSALTGIAQIVAGTWSASSTLSTAYGGTGWNSLQANTVLLGNGSSALATTSAGTDGYVLALSSGVPTWVATSTLSTITGTLSVAKGGTGATTFTDNRLLTGNGTSALVDEANLTFDGSLLTVTGNASTTQIGSTGSAYFATSGGSVGIGTAAPAVKFHIDKATVGNYEVARIQNSLQATGSTLDIVFGRSASGNEGVTWRYYQGGTSYSSFFINGGSDALVIQQGGSVGIGTTSPWRTLSVTGTVGFDGLTATAGAGEKSVCINPTTKEIKASSGTDCTSSSQRFKNDIETLSSGLSELTKLRPVSFKFKSGDYSTHLGFIAEEVNSVDSRLVDFGQDGTPRGVRYAEMTSLLTKAVQELNLKVSDLQASVAVSSGTGTDSLFSWILDKFKTILGISFENGTVKANKICVGETCVTEEQFKAVFGTSSSSSSESSSSSSSDTSSSSSSISSSSSSSEASSSSESSSSSSEASSSSESSSSSETSSSTASSTESSSSVSSGESSS